MAVDPKELLARNKVMVIFYVLALVPVILWVVLVLGGVQGDKRNGFEGEKAKLKAAKNQLETLSKAIETDPNSVYTERHTANYNDRNAKLADQFKGIVTMLDTKDAALEKWFDPGWDKTKDPPENDFQARLNTELGTQKDTYKNMVVDPGPNQTSYLWQEPVVKGNQRALQKKFWVQAAILKALKDGGAERLLATVEFPPIVPGPPPAPNAPPKVVYTAPIPARVIVSASFRDIPKIVRELLAQDIVLKVTRIKAELLPFSITNKDLNLYVNPEPHPIYSDTTYTASQGTPDADQEKVLPEPKIKLTLEVEAVDIDMDQIHKLDEPPPAPAAPVDPGPPPQHNPPKNPTP
jgi:hypothetical protein